VNINFDNKNVLVTGATRGIGNKIANDMLSAGANVIATGTSDESLHLLNDKFNKICVDFLNPNSVKKFIDFLSDTQIDICINNAGINKISPIVDIDQNDWSNIIEVNLTTPFKIIKTISRNMIKNNYGRIINISSIWGTIGKEQRVCYSSSKFGIMGLTLSAAAELAKYNVLINSVSPGFTLTDLTRNVLGEVEMNRISKTIPMRRMAEPSEISNVVMFMCSNFNSYISGQNIIVDGGFTNV